MRHLRVHPATAGVPVGVLGEPHDRVGVRAARVAFVRKPLDPDELLAAQRAHLPRAGAGRA